MSREPWRMRWRCDNPRTGHGDRDGGGDDGATENGAPGSTCTGTVTGACRILDLDLDTDCDSTDAAECDALTQGPAQTRAPS